MQKAAREIWQRATHVARIIAQEENGFQCLVEQLATGDLTALWAVQQAGPVAIPALIEGLNHSHPRVRRNCVDLIDHAGHGGDARCIEALINALRDPVPHIRKAVWHTLTCERCQREAECPGVRPDIVGLLTRFGVNDSNLNLRRQVALLFGECPSDARAQPVLERLLREETDPELLSNAERSLRHHASA